MCQNKIKSYLKTLVKKLLSSVSIFNTNQKMGNKIGILACGILMFTSKQMELEIPTYAYAIIYLLSSIVSQMTGSSGPEVGKTAPPLQPGDLTYLQTKGNEARPGTLGKVVVVEQWATWCPPCVAMVPHLNKIYNQYKGNEDFQLVGVTNETDESKIKAFITEHKMEYSVALDTKQAVSRGYPTSGIPNATIVGKDGNVFWCGHPGSMDAKLAEALAVTLTSRPSGSSTSKTSASSAKDIKKE